MRPKKPKTTEEGDLFRARLDQIINMKHELVQLAFKIDWDWIDGEIAPLYSDKGRPGIETRFVAGSMIRGEAFFQHEFPHERSARLVRQAVCDRASSNG
jgi:IS5 family transposase